MSIRSILAAIIILVILLYSTAVAASSASSIDIDDALSGVSLPEGTHVVKYQGVSTVSLGDPIIVVKGKALDTLEMQLFTALGAKYQLNSSYVVDDGSRTIDGKSIENYDIIVVGGPLHNAYTNELLGRNVLKYKVTSTTMPGLVIESESLPTGHKVLFIASVAGYTYQAPPDTTTVPNEPGGGGNSNGFDKPTATAGAASPTAAPDNLHVTAQPTANPQNVDYLDQYEKALLETGFFTGKNDPLFLELLTDRDLDIPGFFADKSVSDFEKRAVIEESRKYFAEGAAQVAAQMDAIDSFTQLLNAIMSMGPDFETTDTSSTPGSVAGYDLGGNDDNTVNDLYNNVPLPGQ